MRRDPTEWRERVRLWKETGELLYEAGKKKELPKYEDGKGGYRYIQNDNGGWNRITNDLMSDLFANLVVTPQRTLNVESRPNKLYSSESVNSLSNIKARSLPAPRSIHLEQGLELPLIDPIALIAGGGKYSGDIVGDIIGETIGSGIGKIVKFAGNKILLNRLNSELNQGVQRAQHINEILQQHPILTDFGGNTLNYNDYLNKVFPNSKVKDILWHGSRSLNLQQFDISKIGTNTPIKGSVGMYLSPSKLAASNYAKGGLYPVLLNTENPYITNLFLGVTNNKLNVAKIKPEIKSTILSQNDAVIAPHRSEIAFFDPNNALILGSKKDKKMFKDFIEDSGVKSLNSVKLSKPYIRNPYSATWDDFLTEPKLGKYFAEGGEAEVYESFDNPGYLTKIKLKIPEEGTTLEDLEYAVNRDLKINELPGTEPIIYKGFSTPEIIRRSLNQDTRFVSDEFVPIWELRKLLPTSKVNFKAFNVDPMQVVNDFANKHGYKRNVDGSWQFGKIKLTDLAIKNFAFDSFGNLKFIDPMIQMF